MSMPVEETAEGRRLFGSGWRVSGWIRPCSHAITLHVGNRWWYTGFRVVRISADILCAVV